MLKKRRCSEYDAPVIKEPDLKRRRMATFTTNRVLATNRYNANKQLHAENFSTRLQAMYTKYREEDDAIGPSGMLKFSKDLGVEREDVVMFVIAFHSNASKLGRLTRNEFMSGFTKMNVDSVECLRTKVDALRQEATSRLEEIYEFAFRVAKASQAQKVIKLETAIALMRMLIPDQVHTRYFLEFLRNSKYHVINADQWKMFLLFNRSVGENFEGYSVDGAWPVMIDEFVEYVRAKKKNRRQNGHGGS